MTQTIRKAILPVAGLGTRVLPATKSIPKEMLTVVDRPVLQYVVDEAREAGVEHIVFVTGRNKSAIEDYFDAAYELEDTLERKGKYDILERLKVSLPDAGSCSYVRQQAPLGLGHAIWCARDIIGDEPFAVLLPDVIIKGTPGCLKQLCDAYNKKGGNILAVDPVSEENVSSYGVIAPKDNGQHEGRLVEISGMVEKPPRNEAPSLLKITGRYILQPEVFPFLENQAAGAGGEIQLTDAMVGLMQEQSFFAYEFEGQEYDCGSRLGYFEAVLAHAINHEEIGKEARAIVDKHI